MNILLIRPKPHKNTINLQSFMICEPLELEYCSSFLEKQGHTVTIFDGILEKRNPISILENEVFHLVGITGYICHVGIIKKYAAAIKKLDKNIITAVGGVYAEVVPSDYEDENIDYILDRAGLLQLADIAAGKKPEKDYKAVKCFDFPHPDREKTAKYRAQYNYIFHEKCATIKTSFGCPYNCEFCFCTRISPYFTRELFDVISELKEIKEENIFIVDDNFLFDRQRITEFCRLLDENQIKKNYIVFGRADFIAENEDLMLLLKNHGLEAVFVGLESFKESELSDFNKKTTVDENIRAVKTLERCGLRCYAGIIAGHDWEKKDFDNLIRYINSFNNMFVNIQPLTPMPGTPLYERTKDKIIIPREKYQLWDMAHLAIKPTKMSIRRYYYHIIRAYLSTTTTKKMRNHIKTEFGKNIYKFVRRGASKVFWQYLKLAIRG